MDQFGIRTSAAVPRRDGRNRSAVMRLLAGTGVILLYVGMVSTVAWVGFLGWCTVGLARLLLG